MCVIFRQKLKKGHEELERRGVSAGPIEDGGDTQFFEIRDSEGNLIQICEEPQPPKRSDKSRLWQECVFS